MRGFAVTVLTVLAVAACGGGNASTPTPSPTAKPISFTMNALAGSGVTGSGTIKKATGSFTVDVKISGLAPNSSHINHIHKGSCGTPDGIAMALQQLVADASGTASATTTFQQDFDIPSTGWYVNVHAGPDLSSPANAKSISCGDLSTA